MKKTKLHLFAAIIWFAVIFYLLTIPGKELPEISWFDKFQVDKLVHIFLFSVLCYLFSYTIKNSSKRHILIIVISTLGLLYGISMEFVQKYFVANRSCDIDDMVADGVGCLFSFFWWHIQFKKESPDGNRGRNQN